MAQAKLTIDGMTCGHCVAHVQKALEGLSGVSVESVEIGRAVVTYDPTATDLPRIEETLADEGYPARAVPAA